MLCNRAQELRNKYLHALDHSFQISTYDLTCDVNKSNGPPDFHSHGKLSLFHQLMTAQGRRRQVGRVGAHPGFVRSVNPISSRGGTLCPPHTHTLLVDQPSLGSFLRPCCKYGQSKFHNLLEISFQNIQWKFPIDLNISVLEIISYPKFKTHKGKKHLVIL